MKLITSILCVAGGIWIAQNHPDTAAQILAYVTYGINTVIAFAQELLSKGSA